MKRERRAFYPIYGHIYSNHGGGIFRCTSQATRSAWHGVCARMENVKSGWTFEAKGIHRYNDGTIDWDFSTDGTFADGKPRDL